MPPFTSVSLPMILPLLTATSDKRGVDLMSDVLPFGRLWYGEPNAVENAIGYVKHLSRSHDAVIRVYDDTGNLIETHEHKGEFKEWRVLPGSLGGFGSARKRPCHLMPVAPLLGQVKSSIGPRDAPLSNPGRAAVEPAFRFVVTSYLPQGHIEAPTYGVSNSPDTPFPYPAWGLARPGSRSSNLRWPIR